MKWKVIKRLVIGLALMIFAVFMYVNRFSFSIANEQIAWILMIGGIAQVVSGLIEGEAQEKAEEEHKEEEL